MENLKGEWNVLLADLAKFQVALKKDILCVLAFLVMK
jgi:hypothetical protein